MAKILVIDDDRGVLRLVEKTLADSGLEVVCALDAEDGVQLLERERPDVLLLDIVLPENNGLELARKIRAFDEKLPIIFITASDDSGTTIEAMKLGAYDYLLKPLEKQRVAELVDRAIETRRLMQSPVHITDAPNDVPDGDQLVGRSKEILEVYKQIGRVSAQDVAVLIRGESGTGKELVARGIYHHSDRKDKTFLAVNCAALSDTLLESELFGHEKGSFTGADRRHIGKFEQCDGGTIFLDEIGDMSPSTQSKVLRLLQEQKFERVGGTETIQTDVRIISATNRDLEQMIEDGEFRLDLYHRLNAFEIHIPALREREDDIELLVDYFLAKFRKSIGKKIKGVSPETMTLLRGYHWPGNIRELQSALRKAMVMATGPVIVPEFLPKDRFGSREAPAVASQASSNGAASSRESTDLAAFVDRLRAANSHDIYADSLSWMERYLVTRILNDTNGNQSKAAELLGITRGSLRNKIRSLGVSIEHVASSD